MALLSEIEREYYERQSRGNDPYRGAIIIFKEIKEIDPAATAEANGVPKFKTYDIIEVQRGGERTPVRVEEWHKTAYKTQWDAFQAGKEQPINGTPLEQWPLITVEVLAELKHYGIRTIEQLEEPTEETKRRMGPLVAWCKKASDWQKSAKSKQAEVTALREKTERLEKAVAKYEQDIELLIKRIEATEGTRLREFT